MTSDCLMEPSVKMCIITKKEIRKKYPEDCSAFFVKCLKKDKEGKGKSNKWTMVKYIGFKKKYIRKKEAKKRVKGSIWKRKIKENMVWNFRAENFWMK